MVLRGNAFAAIVAALILALGPVGVRAQSPGQSLLDRQEEITSALPRPDVAPVEIPRASIQAPPGAEEVVLNLLSLTLVGRGGAPLVDDGRLPVADMVGLTRPLEGQMVSLADVFDVARDIEIALKRDGFVFTRVVVPRQEIDQAAAAVRIVVLGVTVEAVQIEEPNAPVGQVKELIADIADPLVGLSNPRIDDLERASLLATDLPGVRRATFVPSPGSAPEFIVLSMNVERDPWNAVALVSHRDSPVIGPGVFGGTALANTWGPFGLSTELSYFNSWSIANSSPDLDERNTVQLTQRAFLPTGTAFSLSGLYSRTKPGDLLEPLGLEGDQFAFSLMIEHPVIRSRMYSLWVNGGFDWVDSEIEVAGAAAVTSDDALRVFHAGVRGQYNDPYGQTAASVSARTGVEILGATQSGDPVPSRAGASGSFFSLSGEIRREQPIWREIGARLRVSGQWAPEPVLSSEAFALGGARYLKGYDPSEVLGDSGFAAYGEVYYADQLDFGARSYGYEVYAFSDYGFVHQAEQPGALNSDLASAGGGVRLSVPNGPRLELELAKPVSAELARTGNHDLRIFGSLVWFF